MGARFSVADSPSKTSVSCSRDRMISAYRPIAAPIRNGIRQPQAFMTSVLSAMFRTAPSSVPNRMPAVPEV